MLHFYCSFTVVMLLGINSQIGSYQNGCMLCMVRCISLSEVFGIPLEVFFCSEGEKLVK